MQPLGTALLRAEDGRLGSRPRGAEGLRLRFPRTKPNTVARAYGELARDGVIESRQGKGYFVAQKRQVYTKAERRRRLSPLLDALASEAALLDFSGDDVIAAVEEKLREFGLEPS